MRFSQECSRLSPIFAALTDALPRPTADEALLKFMPNRTVQAKTAAKWRDMAKRPPPSQEEVDAAVEGDSSSADAGAFSWNTASLSEFRDCREKLQINEYM